MRLEWVSAAEGEKFQHVVTEFTEQIRALGPLGWGAQFRDEAADAAGAEVVDAAGAEAEGAREAVPA